MLHPKQWTDDNSVEQCGRCATAFTFLRRRHHCRHCGGVFCGPCTAQRLWLRPWPGSTAAVNRGGGDHDAPRSSLSSAHTPQLASERSNNTDHTNNNNNNDSFPSESSEQVIASDLSNASQRIASALSTGAATGAADAAPSTPASAALRRAPVLSAAAKSPAQQDVTMSRTSAAADGFPAETSPRHRGQREARGRVGVVGGCPRVKLDVADGSRCSAVGLTSSSTEAESGAGDSCNPAPPPDTLDGLVSVPSPTVMLPSFHASSPNQPQQQQQQHQEQPQQQRQPCASVHPLPKPISMGAVSASTAGSRQLSDALLNSSVYAVSPTTVAGEVTPKTWTTPAAVPGLERTASSSAQWPRVASSGNFSGENSLEALVRDRSDVPRTAQTVPAPRVANAMVPAPPCGTSALMASAGRDDAEAAVYADASYRAEVDQRRITWYLCRVCRDCYDTLLDTILDAHEHSPLLPQHSTSTNTPTVMESATSAIAPLWQYVRLSSSTKTHHTRFNRQTSQPQSEQQQGGRGGGAGGSSTMANTAPPGPASPTASKPLLSSAWARLRASVSLPASPVTSFIRLASPTATAPSNTGSPGGSSVGGTGNHAAAAGISPLLPPALRPRDLRRSRNSPATPHSTQVALRAGSTSSPTGAVAAVPQLQASKTLHAAVGVPGLPARLYGPPVAATSTTRTGASALLSDSSRYSSPNSAGHPCEASVLSVSSASFQQVSRQPTEATSPKQQQQQQQQQQQRAAARVSVTPPRRRLISIGNSTGHVRQAVAIARRRRRVAVILIDEREVDEVDVRTTSLLRSSRDEAETFSSVRVSPASQVLPSHQHVETASKAGLVNESSAISFSPCQSPVGQATAARNFEDVKELSQQQQQRQLLRGTTRPSTQIATPVGAALPAERQSSFTDSPTTSAQHPPQQQPQQQRDKSDGLRHDAARTRAVDAGHRLHLSIVVDADEAGEVALQGLTTADWLRPTLPSEAAAATALTTNAVFPSGNHYGYGYACNTGTTVGEAASPNAAPRASLTRESSSMPSDQPTATAPGTAVATSRPISCAGGSNASGSASTPNHTAATVGGSGNGNGNSSTTGTHPHHGHHRRVLPAVLVAPDSGACVLSALFRELGAVTHLSATPATPVFNALTPTSSAAAAAAASGVGHFPALSAAGATSGALFVDPLFSGAMPQSGWGTGPESYAAQRQALVREMLYRQQRAAMVAAAATSATTANAAPAASPVVSPSSGSYVLHNTTGNGMNSNSTANPYLSSPAGGAAGATAATTPHASGLPSTPAHERVTAPVNIYFQLRSPTDSGVLLPPPATNAAPAASGAAGGAPLSINILPVTTQVEMIGIPLDVTAPSANNSPKTLLSPTNSFTSPRGNPATNTAGNNSSSVAGVPGVSRPFTLNEFLPQLAKLSTNLDGYLIVVLRCGSSNSSSHRSRENYNAPYYTSNTSPMLNGAPAAGNVENSPHVRSHNNNNDSSSSCSRRGRRNSLNGPVGAEEKGCNISGGSTTHVCAASYTLSRSINLPIGTSTVFLDGTSNSSGAARSREADLSAARAEESVRRQARVREPFGGPQLRLLFQQLQSCGVTQPALSVIDVCDNLGSHEVLERSPDAALRYSSPLNERGAAPQLYDSVISRRNGSTSCSNNNNYNVSLNHRASQPATVGAGEASSPADTWHDSPSSPMNVAFSPPAAAASPVSSPASSIRLLVPAAQKTATLADDTATKADGPEKLMLPSSVHATRECSTPSDTAATANAGVHMMSCTSHEKVDKYEVRRLAAQEHAIYSLRAAAQQLGLPVSTMSYPACTAAAMAQAASVASAFPVDSPLRNSVKKNATSSGSSGGAAMGGALLSRGLESLAATMVYRDLSAQQ